MTLNRRRFSKVFRALTNKKYATQFDQDGFPISISKQRKNDIHHLTNIYEKDFLSLKDKEWLFNIEPDWDKA
jgi:hypothetical protein